MSHSQTSFIQHITIVGCGSIGLMREMLSLLRSDTCRVSAMDDAMAWGPGLRWGFMGPDTLFHLASGERGAQHMADHVLEPVTTWWAGEDPVLDEGLKRKWVEGTMEAVWGRKFDD